jgi:hypothetical protein
MQVHRSGQSHVLTGNRGASADNNLTPTSDFAAAHPSAPAMISTQWYLNRLPRRSIPPVSLLVWLVLSCDRTRRSNRTLYLPTGAAPPLAII